jgi:DNA-binding MurR/RpiR family transcriptional regulator
MVECITTDSQCPPPGFSIGGISIVEVLEEWESDYLTHHLLVLDFNSEIIKDYFSGNDLCILAGSNLTSSGLVLQLSGRHSSIVKILNAIKEEMPVERITRAKKSKGISNINTTLQQHKIIKVAHINGWYEVPKKTSIRDIATKLGLSKSTVAEQLVKAEGEIVRGFLKNSK